MTDKKGNIVMMHGYICSLKTVISSALAKELGTARLETKQLGPIDDNYGKFQRYTLFVKLAKTCAEAGRDVILDGTFGDDKHRQEIYQIGEQLGVEDIVVIYCFCNDEKEIWRRIHERKEADKVCISEWLNQTHTVLSNDKYDGSSPSIIQVDTGKYEMKIESGKTHFSQRIGEKLEKIIKKLSKT